MQNLKGPASDSQKNVVLVVCLLVMSAMCIGLIWQAQIISNQKEDIKWLQTLKFGGEKVAQTESDTGQGWRI